MHAGTIVCFLVILIGLTLQSGLRFWWWIAGFAIGWAVNMAIYHGARWLVRRKYGKVVD